MSEDVMDKIDHLMLEYAQYRADPANRARAKRLQGAAFTAMLPSPDSPSSFAKKLIHKLSHYLRGYSDPPEDAMIDYVWDMMLKYDPQRNSSFTKWILGENLLFWVRDNYIKKHKDEVLLRGSSDGDADENPDDPIASQPDTTNSPIALTDLAFMLEHQIALMCSKVQFIRHNPSKANNPTRLRYTQCFMTDILVNLCQKQYLDHLRFNEREALDSMEQGLLDLILQTPCKSFTEIRCTCLKTYRSAGISAETDEIDLPLKNPVYRFYLSGVFGKPVSDSLVSQQHNKFYDLIEYEHFKKTFSAE